MAITASNCVQDTATVKVRVVNGILTADAIIMPPPAGSQCVQLLENPDKNGLTKTPTGLAVRLGKSPGVTVFKDCVTQEVRARVNIRKMRTDTADLNGPANFTDLLTARTFNGLYETEQGMQVLVGASDKYGTVMWVDNDTQEIKCRLKLSGQNIDVSATCPGSVIAKNALRVYPDGVAVLVSGNPPAFDTVTNSFVAGPGGEEYLKGNARTWLDCVTGEIKVDVVLARDGQVTGGIGGTSGCLNLISNAIQRAADDGGLQVLAGKANGIECYVDCITREIKAKPIFDPADKNLMTVNDNGIKFNIAKKGPANEAGNGLVIVSPTTFNPETGLNADGGLWAPGTFIGTFEFERAGFSWSHGTGSVASGGELCVKVKNTHYAPVTAQIYIRSSAAEITTLGSCHISVGYQGNYGIGAFTYAFSEASYARIDNTDAFAAPLKSDVVATLGPYVAAYNGHTHASNGAVPSGTMNANFVSLMQTAGKHQTSAGQFERRTLSDVQPGQEVWVKLSQKIDLLALQTGASGSINHGSAMINIDLIAQGPGGGHLTGGSC